MLVLRRKAGEAIVLNGVITIYVLAVEGERVKLGISAPPEVVIVRSELLDTPVGAPGASVGGRPSAPQIEGGPDYGRGPRGPERPYRENERPYREPEPSAHPAESIPPAGPDQSGRFGPPARYTPRRRYDNYGNDADDSLAGPQDVMRYR